jgi:hypothetical protein
MAAKRGTKKPSKARPDPVLRSIQVAVDTNGNFTYTANGQDASVLRPNINDTITWAVTLIGVPVPFQVEFDGFSPFQGGVQVIRSLLQTTSPVTVSLPAHYLGNLVFKYTVSLFNGWYDDPIIQPVPSDGFIVTSSGSPSTITLSVDSNGNLVLTPPSASFPKGEVQWVWAANQPADDFTVTFPPNTPGFPLQATSSADTLDLNLQTAGGPVIYTVATLDTGLSASGSLTIS